MQSLAAGHLAEADQAAAFEAFLHLARRFDDRREGHVRSGIEVEKQPAGYGRMPGQAVPRVELDGRGLSKGRQSFDAIDLKIGFSLRRRPYELDQVRRARRSVALEELLTVNAVGRADDRTGPSPQMRHDPFADRFVVAGEIELGDRLAVAAVGP